jgi:hypothetical protein
MVAEAKSNEEATVAAQIENMKTVVSDAIRRGVDSTIDWDPINLITEKTTLGGASATDLGEAPAPEEYEKSMWQAWISVYAYSVTERVRGGCMGRVDVEVKDNVGKDLREEMDRVASELAKKGIDPSWLTQSLGQARAAAEAELQRRRAAQRAF